MGMAAEITGFYATTVHVGWVRDSADLVCIVYVCVSYIFSVLDRNRNRLTVTLHVQLTTLSCTGCFENVPFLFTLFLVRKCRRVFAEKEEICLKLASSFRSESVVCVRAWVRCCV